MLVKPFDILPPSDADLKRFLNFNPVHRKYTLNQQYTDRDPNETDRGGWRGYDRVYSYHISHLRLENLKLLEIGVHSGYGLLAWARYFSNSSIYGLEIDEKWKPSYSKLMLKHEEFNRIFIKFRNSLDPPVWTESYFDIIIDDGSHAPIDQINTFKNYWSLVKPGGYFFIEDISSRYTTENFSTGYQEVFNLLIDIKSEGNFVEVYKHTNHGFLNTVLYREKSSFKKNTLYYRLDKFKDMTPYSGIDYIAVIRKKGN